MTEFAGYPKPPRPPVPGKRAWTVALEVVVNVVEYADTADEAKKQAEKFLGKLLRRPDLDDPEIEALDAAEVS